MDARYTRSFTARRFYPHMPQEIWNLITSEQFILTDWVLALEGPVTTRTGFSLSVKTAAIPGTAFTGHFDCQFIDVRPYEKLMFQLTAIAPNPRTFQGLWKISQKSRGTDLSFTLSGFSTKPLNHVPVYQMLEKALERVITQLPTPDL